ncbi:MAG: ABC transporter permease subunit [Oscillospiraceae bacterium]|nr:ABC transporter permease subunit [Oscillospiraceae bacterium]
MLRYFLKRILLLIPVIVAVSFIVFTLMDLAPGDALAGWDLSDMSDEAVAALRADLGLDDPLIVRYGRYMLRLLQGDLGVSDLSGISVWETFIARLPNTLILALVALVFAVVISIPMGMLAARRAGKITDNLTTAFTMLGMSMPAFWLGILLILFFSYQLTWFPAGGFRDGWRSIILPAVCVSMTMLASSTRQTRSSMLEVLSSDYLRTARAKGVPENQIIRKHALGNALIPIVTNIGLSLGVSISGSAVVETVFAWPGIGRFVVESVASRDVTATTGAVILTTVLYVMVQLLVDLAYALIDPRIKQQYISAGKSKKRAKRKEPTTYAPVAQEVAAHVVAAATLTQRDETTTSIVSTDDAEQQDALSKDIDAQASMSRAEASEANMHEGSFVSFATKARQDIDSKSMSKTNDNSGESVSKKYKKRSQIGEIVHHLFKNKGAVAGLVIVAGLIVCFIASLFMSFESMTAASIPDRFSPPSWQFLFGTDGMGRNQFLRVIYATRFSLPIGFGATAVAAVVGVFLGSLAAYYEGNIADDVIMRFSDTLASIPGILLGMVIITTLGRSLTNLIIAVGVAAVPIFIRLSRASILSIKGNEFVEAARAVGLPSSRIIFTQVLPNGLAPLIVAFSNVLGLSILISASLSFLGFGIPIPNPEWGQLVAAGRDNIRNAWWLTTFPGLFIMLALMAFNLLGDGLRDALDPKLKK